MKNTCHYTWLRSLLQFCYDIVNCLQQDIKSMLSVIHSDWEGKLHVINWSKLEAIAEVNSVRQSLQLRLIRRVLVLHCLKSGSQEGRREEWIPGNEW